MKEALSILEKNVIVLATPKGLHNNVPLSA